MVFASLARLLSRTAEKPLLMGVLNVTPDSFSDGGRFTEADAWRAHIDDLLRDGADVIDIGGESTRPGAPAVPAEAQLARIGEPISYAVSCGALVSVDTTLPEVAEAALVRGARIVNDVSCLREERLAQIAARAGAELIIMHSRGSMAAGRSSETASQWSYGDVVSDVCAELSEARSRALACGLSPEALLFDPGLGFHKSADASYALLAGLSRLSELGPLVVGASRKSFLQRDVASSADARLGGTIAACFAAFSRGARVLRVHDVLSVRQAFAVARAVSSAGSPALQTTAGAADV